MERFFEGAVLKGAPFWAISIREFSALEHANLADAEPFIGEFGGSSPILPWGRNPTSSYAIPPFCPRVAKVHEPAHFPLFGPQFEFERLGERVFDRHARPRKVEKGAVLVDR
jgi:hypothetical protein